MKFKGKSWKFGDHINTDLILPVPVIFMPLEEHARHVFEANRPGWADQVQEGEILIGGKNFGTGSSRPAAQSLKLTGLGAMVAESLNGLFFRNCVNHGFFAMECPGIHDAFTEGDVAQLDFETFEVTNITTGQVLSGRSFPDSLLNIMKSGGVLPQLESEGLVLSQSETARKYSD